MMVDGKKRFSLSPALGLVAMVSSFLAFPSTSHALYELTGGFGYSKQVYGDTRQNSMVDRTYSGGFTLYLTGYTGVELDYSQEEEIITENETVELGSGLSITSTQNKMMTKVYGIGLKQALAPDKFFIVPVLSLGYAQQVKTGDVSYTVSDSVTGYSRIFTFVRAKETSDSVFATFLLKFQLTKTFSLNGSVKSVFKAFKFNEYRDNLKYEAGFSWLF